MISNELCNSNDEFVFFSAGKTVTTRLAEINYKVEVVKNGLSEEKALYVASQRRKSAAEIDI